ncbi:hypothetical protein PR002_g24279 [Phytophthora rubi]|uniref:Uncharacterized protein n=1 Tax=Phytophthora rubi TaxID=129364 RepID=A0A6A3ID55_9STRA|nr:hypothetical protein PR002_g24279 [Phytophthora rubi]
MAASSLCISLSAYLVLTRRNIARDVLPVTCPPALKSRLWCAAARCVVQAVIAVRILCRGVPPRPSVSVSTSKLSVIDSTVAAIPAACSLSLRSCLSNLCIRCLYEALAVCLRRLIIPRVSFRSSTLKSSHARAQVTASGVSSSSRSLKLCSCRVMSSRTASAARCGGG